MWGLYPWYALHLASPLPSQTAKGELNELNAAACSSPSPVERLQEGAQCHSRGVSWGQRPPAAQTPSAMATRALGQWPCCTQPAGLLKLAGTQCNTDAWLASGARVRHSPLSSSRPAGPAGRLGQGASAYCGRLCTSLWKTRRGRSADFFCTRK